MNYSYATAEKIEECFDAFPSRVIVMLYDEAIAALDRTVAAIEAGDIEARFFATARVADVVAELIGALDLEEGGEIAAALDAVYRTVIVELPMINIRNDKALASRLIDILKPIRNAWAALDDRIRWDVGLAEALDSHRRKLAARQRLTVVASAAE